MSLRHERNFQVGPACFLLITIIYEFIFLLTNDSKAQINVNKTQIISIYVRLKSFKTIGIFPFKLFNGCFKFNTNLKACFTRYNYVNSVKYVFFCKIKI